MAARLQNVTQNYTWGSKTLLAGLRGLPPSSSPEAEVWMGAHPKAPSMLPSGQSLLEAIQRAPDKILGSALHRRYGARLPFLLKLIAIEQPLSLQAHPSAEQALQGYERETALGIPASAPNRNYVDASHKPELLVALSEVSVLVGFRKPTAIVECIARLQAPLLLAAASGLQSNPTAAGLEALFKTLMTAPEPQKAELVRQTLVACAGATSQAPEHTEYARALAIAKLYPSDIGVVISLLLNHLRLLPGQGIYLPARTLHAYLSGLGVEIMAASDNVLRGGLTPKHVDVTELLRVLRFDSSESAALIPRIVSRSDTTREELYPTDAAEFSLTRLTLTSGATWKPEHPGGPEILLLVEGAVTIRGADEPIMLAPGDSAFVAVDEVYEIHGAGVVFRASAK